MRGRDWAYLVWLVVCSLFLAAFEVLYLPLRFDGYLLPMLWGGFPFPITAVVALLTVPMFVRRAGQLSPSLAIAGAPLAAWLLIVLVSAFSGPGGDIVLIPDWRALLLLGGGSLAGAVALGGVIGRAARR
ncbi:hypothetical protein [Actinocrispum wychmicini]|uniref:Uncharacterized protein n=1 Tax=Actinocrispum wychmicini TaxID=1213861 RepID=A0A4R2JHM6_9PSEU|nr:hypothetical protein [Actinocrispum wychmicini]TCO58574.1 hypothetical protein EV192_105645 [Actinocrispum wychmicini]